MVTVNAKYHLSIDVQEETDLERLLGEFDTACSRLPKFQDGPLGLAYPIRPHRRSSGEGIDSPPTLQLCRRHVTDLQNRSSRLSKIKTKDKACVEQLLLASELRLRFSTFDYLDSQAMPSPSRSLALFAS